MVEQGEVLTLSDNKTYAVVFTTMYNNRNYIYLIDENDYTNTMFCVYDNNQLEEVTDPNTIEALLYIYQNSSNK